MLPTSASLSIDDDKFLADLVVFGIEVSGLAILLKPWIKRQ